MSRPKSDLKFLEILSRYNLPINGFHMSVVANVTNRVFSGRGSRMTFYGVGQPIPPKVVEAIRTEVFPLLIAEGTAGIISEEVLSWGEPESRRNAFAEHCRIHHMGD